VRPRLVKEYEQQYNDGLITQGEKYNKVVDAWAKCTDKVADEMMARIKSVRSTRKRPPEADELDLHDEPLRCAWFAEPDAQLGGMRGLMAKPSGEIIETPIISNFKEGLTVLEYFNSTHGARKGLADTALKTANSGYLTRRLVDVAQDCIITHVGLRHRELGITVTAIVDAGQVVASLGRVSLAAPRLKTSIIRHRRSDRQGRFDDREEVVEIEAAGIQGPHPLGADL
jgi:DNA-directed RNA polymerase subunit beta'